MKEKFCWCRWGSSLLGLCMLDPLLGPPSPHMSGGKDSVGNPCGSVRDGIGFPLLGIAERLIPAHLTMLDEKNVTLLI